MPQQNPWQLLSAKVNFEGCFNVSEYLVRTARELKKFKGILAKSAQKQGKVIYQNMIDLVCNMYEDDEFSDQMPGKKDHVSIAKRKTEMTCSMQPKRNVCCLQGKIS